MTRAIRAVIGVLAVLLTTALVAAPPAQGSGTLVGGIPIVGKTYTTWKAAGGTAKFGNPVAARVSATIAGRTARLQRFEKGQVFYSSLGKQTFTYPSTLKLSGVTNERDALARYGFAPGVLLRTAKLNKATKLDKLKLAAELKGGVIIDLRTSSAIKIAPDPKLPGVTRYNFAIDPNGTYANFVTDKVRRDAFANALRTAAKAKGTVLIHCTLGRDRTGWMTAMLMYILGASDSQVRSEYLRTSTASASTLQVGLDQAIASYGSIDGYLRTGLGLSDADFAALTAKFA
ncbi:MAG: tyrosine-protein phosphatase [Propionibacteriales bacterium]|nr:tyrosine-protein phosphatase [Propionibacteriales bacterium]